METFLSFFEAHAVLILALLCIPISGFFLWRQRDMLGLSGWKLCCAPFLYVIFGLLSIIVFSILHDINTFPKFVLHHQGLLVVFPLMFPLAAKLLKKDWRDVSDALAVSIPGIVAVLRVFCLLNGCCYGRCFAWSETHIPLREIVICVNLLVCFLFLIWVKHRHPRGVILPAYWLFYGLFRLWEVANRYNPMWPNNPGDRVFAVISIVAGFIGVMWILELDSKEYKRSKKRRKRRE